MKVTAIEEAKGTRYTVFVDDEYWYIIDAEIILNNRLVVGKEVSQDELDDMKEQAQMRKARERAYYLISYRDHSEKELFQKLCKSVDEHIAAKVTAIVIEQGLIDDEAYAQKLAEYYLTSKKWGKRRALFEMTKKGIDKQLAQSALEECDVDPTEYIKEIISRKYYDKLDDYHSKQKVIASLMRLGFNYSDIKVAIEEYGCEEFEDEYCEDYE